MVRLKHRWLIVEVLYPNDTSTIPFSVSTDSSVNTKVLTETLRQQISYNFGDHGIGLVSASLLVKYFSCATSTGIIRVSRDHYRMVWAALTFIKELGGRECVITVRRVSGTIKKAEEELLRRDKTALDSTKTGNV